MHIAHFILLAKKNLLISICLGIIAGLSQIGLLAVLNKLLFNVQNIKTGSILLFVFLLILTFISESSAQILFYRLSQNILFKLQNTICQQILKTSLQQLEKIGISRIYSVLTQDIQILSLTALSMPILLINIILVIGCLIYIYILSPIFFIYLLLFILANSFVFIFLDVKFFKKKLDLARQNVDDLFTGYDGILRGIKELKLHQAKQKAFFQENIKQPTSQYRSLILQSLGFYSIAQNIWKTNFFILLGAIILFSSFQNIHASTSSLAQIFIIIIYLISPISIIITAYPNIRRALLALKKIQSLNLQEASDKNIKTSSSVKINSWHKVALHQITYTYETDEPNKSFMLGPMDLTFHPGEIIFLTGKNGAGKSTLVKLISGLYVPQSGSIFIDNEMNTNMETYREYFSVIFSDYYLFDKMYGIHPDADQVNHYLDKLELKHLVTINNEKFSTIKLSEGQRKRLALLSAYFEERKIYIFDEWAANQDPTFKNAFYTQFIVELKNNNKSVIVISHDKDYFYMADRIYHLDNGRLCYLPSFKP